MSAEKDRQYMLRCLALAAKADSKSIRTNPRVGACIVHKERIIGEGFHQVFGGPHAEVNAIEDVATSDLHLLPQAKLYVSLEPCNHTGKTGACTEAIRRAKIPEVCVGMLDPNPNVAGGGIARLKRENIGVTRETSTEAQNRKLNKFFLTNMLADRPYICLKWAASADGYLGQEGQRTQISGPYAQRLTHGLRRDYQAILVGGNTVRVDDPELSCRWQPGSDPIPIILASRNMPKESKLYKREDLLYFGKLNEKIDITGGTHLLADMSPVEPDALLRSLLDQNIGSVLVEGGAMVLQSFIDANLWDEVFRIQGTAKLTSGVAAPKFNFKPQQIFPLGDDTLLRYCHFFEI